MLERHGSISRALLSKNFTTPLMLYIAGEGKPLELSPKELKRHNRPST
jgi:hypothetical protein